MKKENEGIVKSKPSSECVYGSIKKRLNNMKLKIQTGLNNKILRTVAEEIVDFSEAKKIVKAMKDYLRNSDD
jgi:hypothetical protein